jgi:hypothetical protein
MTQNHFPCWRIRSASKPRQRRHADDGIAQNKPDKIRLPTLACLRKNAFQVRCGGVAANTGLRGVFGQPTPSDKRAKQLGLGRGKPVEARKNTRLRALFGAWVQKK